MSEINWKEYIKSTNRTIAREYGGTLPKQARLDILEVLAVTVRGEEVPDKDDKDFQLALGAEAIFGSDFSIAFGSHSTRYGVRIGQDDFVVDSMQQSGLRRDYSSDLLLATQ